MNLKVVNQQATTKSGSSQFFSNKDLTMAMTHMTIHCMRSGYNNSILMSFQ